MRFLFRRTSPFARALQAYGLARCSLSGSTLWVGLPPDPEYRREPLGKVPEGLKSLCFVEAPNQAELVAALAASPEAETLEHLMIGTSHDYARDRAASYDMSGAVAALRSAQFLALRRLTLGDMEMLFNGHRYFGRLGDVTHIFAAAGSLEVLALCGQFSLTEPVQHPALRELSVEVDDIGVSGGPLSEETVSHLLSSRFPALQTLDLDLDDGEREVDYTLPEAFFAGAGLPALKVFNIDCLAPEAETRLADWKRDRGIAR